MKRTIFIIAFFILSMSSMLFAFENSISLSRNGNPPVPRILSQSSSSYSDNIPVSATVDEINLSIYFESVVGVATITIYDATNQIIDVEVVDTNLTNEAFIPIDILISGGYSITITYGDTTLAGEFQLP